MNRSIIVFLLLFCLPLTALPQADSKETLNIHTSPIKYDSIIASWKANSLVESAEQFLEDEYIILDTSRYMQAVSTVSDTICPPRSISHITTLSVNTLSPTRQPINRLHAGCSRTGNITSR